MHTGSEMRKQFSIVLVLLAAVGFAVAAAAARADTWLTYQNDRYGTTIDYPGIFKPEPLPDADDGRAFKSADGAKFSVSASYAGIDFTLATYRDFILKNLPAGETVTYQASGKTWFVISGTKVSDVFYERHMLSHGGEMTEDFVISYPAAGKPIYDPIAARMAKSFRSGEGFQTQKAK
jgi:hypothetical protein